jgi:hypothetical protein
LPLDASDDPHVLTLEVSVSGQQVEVPAYAGIDRLREVGHVVVRASAAS